MPFARIEGIPATTSTAKFAEGMKVCPWSLGFCQGISL